ncbi:hypothetical protein D3C81_2071950 [compost metagenome]
MYAAAGHPWLARPDTEIQRRRERFNWLKGRQDIGVCRTQHIGGRGRLLPVLPGEHGSRRLVGTGGFRAIPLGDRLGR